MTAERAGAAFYAIGNEIERLGLPRDFLMQMPTTHIIAFCMLDEAGKRRVCEAISAVETVAA